MNLKKKFVVGAASVALIASMGGVAAPAAFAAPSLPGSLTLLDRLAGADRVATSLEVAKHEWAGRPDNGRGVKAERVYLASGDDSHLVDMAGAGMLVDGPIVFVTNNVYVGTAVGQALEKFGGLKEVVPIGGTTAIADSVAKSVADEITGAKVGTRLAGEDRYATSAAIANYIYAESTDSQDDWYQMTTRGGNFGCLNFANGADAHLVDAMVAGTLDNCPTVLSNPDGSIPESVAEVIKKTLPLQFNALGGTAAVPDSTIQDAWVIKTLGNKWETSYDIPNIVKTLDGLNRLVDGCGDKDDTILPSDTVCNDFMGLIKIVKFADQQAASWEQEVASLKNQIADIFKNATWKLPAPAVQAQIRPILENIYGKAVMDQFAMAPSADMTFVKQNKGEETYAGVDYGAIEATTAYKNVVKAAKDDLETLWRGLKQDTDMGNTGALRDPVAQLSQLNPAATGVVARTSLGAVANPSLAAVAQMARYTHATDKAWLETSKAQQAELLGKLRVERDKIAVKSEWRLGGADRYETAQLIANAWADLKGNADAFHEVYIANGHRMADNLAAGQLTQGPIVLVKGDEAKAADLPEFTQKVAINLQCWNSAKRALGAYGIGGTAVLADSALGAIVNLVNTKSVCTPKSASKPDVKPSDNKLTAKLDQPAVKGSQNGTVSVYWDGVLLTELAEDANDKDGKVTSKKNVADGYNDVKTSEVSTSTAKGSGADDGIDAEITVAGGKITLAHANLTVTAGKVGKVSINVTYRGKTITVDIPVYGSASAAADAKAASETSFSPLAATLNGGAAMTQKVLITEANHTTAITTAKAKAELSKFALVAKDSKIGGAALGANDMLPDGFKLSIEFGPNDGDPAYWVVTWPAGKASPATFTTGDFVKVKVTREEPNKAPTESTFALPAIG